MDKKTLLKMTGAAEEVPQGEPGAETGEALGPIQEQEARSIPQSCINCGQDWIPVEVVASEDGDAYHCPACDYHWTLEHEAAPFRTMTSGTEATPVDPIQYGDWPTVAERYGGRL